MKNLFFYCFVVLATCLMACSPKTATQLTPTSATAATSVGVPTEKSLLWKISGKDFTKPSYLYGTIHMIAKDDFFLTDSTLAVFDRADKVVFEIDMNEMSDMGALMGMMGKIMMNDGSTLSGLLSAADYQLVSDHFSKMGLPMMMLDRIKPMFLSAMTEGDFDLSNPGGGLNGDIKSYEMEFMEMAKEDKKPIAGLETIEYQLSVFDSIPYKEQANMLVDGIKNKGEAGADELSKITKLYKDQDIVAMQSMFEGEESGLGKYEDIFLKNRNQNWIPVMEEMSKTGTVFYAVGAGHLGGKNGVIALLRKAGYQVTPIMSKPASILKGGTRL